MNSHSFRLAAVPGCWSAPVSIAFSWPRWDCRVVGDHVVGEGEDDLFRTFMDNSPLVAFIADAEDRMVYSSAPLPLTSEQVGASMWDLLPEEYIEAYRPRMHAARETGEAQQLIGPGPSQDGRPGWFRTHYFLLPGRWVGGVGLDVTELVDAQAELATARDQRAGLRLVATLVAQEADEQTVLEATADAAGRVLAARVSLARLDRTDLRSPPSGMTATSADSNGAEPPSEEELARVETSRTCCTGRAGGAAWARRSPTAARPGGCWSPRSPPTSTRRRALATCCATSLISWPSRWPTTPHAGRSPSHDGGSSKPARSLGHGWSAICTTASGSG